MTVLPQEVWYADFPFRENSARFKERPVIVLDVDDDSCTVFSMKVTSREPFGEYEIEIFDWADVPLDHKSTADASDVRAINKSRFRRKIGRLSDDDWNNIVDLHKRYLKSIGEFF